MAISRMQEPQQIQSGIGSLQDPRQGYFLGKLVKKAGRAVKKITKSPLGKLAIGAAGLYGSDLEKLGIPDEEKYIELYCERTGRSKGLPDREFYSAYNFFRIAAILQGIAGRIRDGTAASSEAMKIVKAVEPLAKVGASYATKERA